MNTVKFQTGVTSTSLVDKLLCFYRTSK